METVLVGFAVNVAATVVAIGFLERRIKTVLQQSAFRETLGPAAEFWRVPQTHRPWTVLIGGRPTGGSDPHLRISWPTFTAFIRIHDALRGLYGSRVAVSLRHLDEITDWAAIAEGNLVILGGISNFPGLADMFPRLGLPVIQTYDASGEACLSVQLGYSEPALILPNKSGIRVQVDHGLILRLLDYAGGSAFFAFCGCGSLGTEAAVKAMLDPEKTREREFDFRSNFNWTIATVDDPDRRSIDSSRSRITLSHSKAEALPPSRVVAVRNYLRRGGLSARTADPSPPPAEM